MDFNDLSEEQKLRAVACETIDDLTAFAEEEGIELTAEQLEAVSGGNAWSASCSGYDMWSCPTDYH